MEVVPEGGERCGVLPVVPRGLLVVVIRLVGLVAVVVAVVVVVVVVVAVVVAWWLARLLKALNVEDRVRWVATGVRVVVVRGPGCMRSVEGIDRTC